LGFVFDQDDAQRQEAWYQTETGRECLRLQKRLMLRLIRPTPGERLLDVGCGSGIHLQIFKREGLTVTGLDPSAAMLKMAEIRLGGRIDLCPGQAEDLPFEDNAFDIVTLITCLEFADDPETALAEAVRVSRSRIFIGVLNSLSLTAMLYRINGLFRDSPYNRARFFSLWDLAPMVRRLAGSDSIRWASAGLLPPGLLRYGSSFEARPLVQRNPFGAFLGLAADMTYRLRTDNLPLKTGLKLAGKHAPSTTSCLQANPGPPRLDLDPSTKEMNI